MKISAPALLIFVIFLASPSSALVTDLSIVLPLWPNPEPFVQDALKTGLRFGHFVALAVGLGGATLLDLMMIRFCLLGEVSRDLYSIFDFTSKVIAAGLVALWISGFGFLLYYAAFDPTKLINPKVHAKLVIVAILTLNGMFIHRQVLPFLAQQIGKPLFSDVTSPRRALLLLSGSVSAASWYTPVALGVFWQLNFSVAAEQILMVYLLLILAAFACASLLQRVVSTRLRHNEAHS